jgi:hypothetical protein
MFKFIREAYRRVISFCKKRSSDDTSSAAILRSAKKQLLGPEGPVVGIQTRVKQSLLISDVGLLRQVSWINCDQHPDKSLRHQLNTVIDFAVDNAASKYGTVTAETRRRLVANLKVECLKLSGLPSEYTTGETARIVRDVKVHSHSTPICQGSPPLMSRRDPVRGACHSPQNQTSSKSTSPSYHISPSPAADKYRHHNLSEESASQSSQCRAAATRVTPERYDTSTSADRDYVLDPRMIRATEKSPPPGWYRPLPDEDPADIMMVETEGVLAEREHHYDTYGHGQGYVRVTVLPIRSGYEGVPYTCTFA